MLDIIRRLTRDEAMSMPDLWRAISPEIPRQTFNNRVKALALDGAVTIFKVQEGDKIIRYVKAV